MSSSLTVPVSSTNPTSRTPSPQPLGDRHQLPKRPADELIPKGLKASSDEAEARFHSHDRHARQFSSAQRPGSDPTRLELGKAAQSALDAAEEAKGIQVTVQGECAAQSVDAFKTYAVWTVRRMNALEKAAGHLAGLGRYAEAASQYASSASIATDHSAQVASITSQLALDRQAGAQRLTETIDRTIELKRARDSRCKTLL